jgi:Skp family chaperone for outer membrane proteins
MSRRKQKSTAPLLDQLSAPLKEFVEDFGRHGKAVLERVRERSPEKYLELSCKLAALVATLKPKGDEMDGARNPDELAVALLREIGMPDDAIDEDAILAAVEANDEFCQTLEAIKRKRAQKLEKTEVDEAEAVIKHLQDTTGLPS